MKNMLTIDSGQSDNPIRIRFANHNVTEYVYAADGRRLKTTHRTSVPRSDMPGTGGTATLTASETMSVDSAEYIGNFICDNGTPKRYCFDDGYLMLYNTTFTPRYYIKDHLGNNRMVVTGAGAVYQNNNCYPYGGMTALGSGQGYQQFKYNGKEYDPMHGLDEYDYGARQYDPAIGRFTTIDPLCEKYYHISPYTYCAGNPVRFVDPDGRSTWVINRGNGNYQVVGGDINDHDRNIYVGNYNSKNVFVPQNSIGISSSITSFYNSDTPNGGSLSKGSVININDNSGDKFLSDIIENNPPMFDDYMMNARNGRPYDFKVTNGTNHKIDKIDKYRGMPIGVTGNGQKVFSSARDIGNIAAGYIAAVNGMTWEASTAAFNGYQGGIEGKSTRNAEYYGWKMGYNNTNNIQKSENLMRSFGRIFMSLWNYLIK